jgi:hypothetical protein
MVLMPLASVMLSLFIPSEISRAGLESTTRRLLPARLLYREVWFAITDQSEDLDLILSKLRNIRFINDSNVED